MKWEFYRLIIKKIMSEEVSSTLLSQESQITIKDY